MKLSKKIVFLEGLPGVGKTTILNTIKKSGFKDIHTVDELLVNLEEKTPTNQDIFIFNDNQKLKKFNSGLIVIDRGPLSTLSYNQVRSSINKSFSDTDVINWFNKIKKLYESKNVKIIYLTTNGEKYYIPFKNDLDPYGSIKNQKMLEEISIKNCKKYSRNVKIIEYHQKNIEEIINEIIN